MKSGLKRCGFCKRIHWFCVDGRPIHVIYICVILLKGDRLSFRLITGIVQASVAGKKAGGLLSCQVSAESPGLDLTVGGWLTCFVSKLGGEGGDSFVTLIRFSSQKAVQSQGIFPFG